MRFSVMRATTYLAVTETRRLIYNGRLSGLGDAKFGEIAVIDAIDCLGGRRGDSRAREQEAGGLNKAGGACGNWAG